MDISIVKEKVRLKGKQSSADVDGGVSITRPDGSNFNIDSPGEYEAAGVSVIGVKNGSTCVYVVEIEDLRICVLNSQITEKLSSEVLEALGAIDITISHNLDLAKHTDPYVVVVTKPESGLSEPVYKYQITQEKLPSDLQVVVLTTK